MKLTIKNQDPILYVGDSDLMHTYLISGQCYSFWVQQYMVCIATEILGELFQHKASDSTN